MQPLVDRAPSLRDVQRKSGYLDVEGLACSADHAVRAGHEAGRGRKRHAAGAFKILARFKHGLFAHHTRPAHLLKASLSIRDPPMPRLELDGFASQIRKRDRISPEVVSVVR